MIKVSLLLTKLNSRVIIRSIKKEGKIMKIDLSKIGADKITRSTPYVVDIDDIEWIEGRGNNVNGFIKRKVSLLTGEPTGSRLYYANVEFEDFLNISPNQFLLLDNGEKLILDCDPKNMPEIWQAVNIDKIASIDKIGLDELALTDKKIKEYKKTGRDYLTKILIINKGGFLLNEDYDDVVNAVNDLKEKRSGNLL